MVVIIANPSQAIHVVPTYLLLNEGILTISSDTLVEDRSNNASPSVEKGFIRGLSGTATKFAAITSARFTYLSVTVHLQF